MLIFISGNDVYLATQAIRQIKDKYLIKNDGAELIEIDEVTPEPNWADLQAVPLFATSRLIVIRRLGLFPASTLRSLSRVLAETPRSTVVVAWDAKPIAEPDLVKTLQAADKTIPVATPTGRARLSWLQKRARELEVAISAEELQGLTALPGIDLWWLETELESRRGGQGASAQEKTSEPFAFFNLVRRRDWQGVKKELAKKSRHGEPIELILGGLAAAVRKELKNEAERRAVLPFLLDLDLGLKTGLLEGESAAALISAHLPVPAEERVQWEKSWEEMAS